MSLKQSTWFSDSFLALLLTLMRYAWLWPWFELARRFFSPQHTGELLAPWTLIVLPLLAFGLTRFVAGESAAGTERAADDDAPTWGRRLLVAVLGLLAMIAVLWWQLYATTYALWHVGWHQQLGDALIHWDINIGLPAPGIAILVLLTLWLKGQGDAVRAMTHDDIWGVLLTGIVALVLYLALLSRSSAGIPPTLFQQVLLLFAAGMVALAFSSLKITVGLDRALGLGQRRVSAAPMLSRYWLISVTTTVVVLLGIGLGIGALVAPEQLARLIAALRVVTDAIGSVIRAILLVVGYVLFVIAYYLALILAPILRRLFDTLQESPLMELARLPEAPPAMEQVIADPTVIPDSYRWMALAIFVIGMLLLLALAVRRLRTTPATEVDEVRESILTTDLLQSQLTSLWERWFGRRQKQDDPFLSLTGEEDARQRIRAAYQQLLATATTLGQGRRPGATPTEYQTELRLPVAEASQPLAALTAAYHQARYAPDAPTGDVAAAALAAWQQLENELAAQQTLSASSPKDH